MKHSFPNAQMLENEVQTALDNSDTVQWIVAIVLITSFSIFLIFFIIEWLSQPSTSARATTSANKAVDEDALEASLPKEIRHNQKATLIPNDSSLSHIEAAIIVSRTLEQLLESKFLAEGKGLHEKLTSIEHKIPEHLSKALRWIATVRNNTVHGDAKPFDKEDYIQTANQIIYELNMI